jgi:flagellar biosynthesis component FlhA
MGAALEILIVPLLVVTAVVILTVLADLHVAVVLAGAVFLGILYFVFIGLLKQEHQEDLAAPASGEEEEEEEEEEEDEAPGLPEEAVEIEGGAHLAALDQPERPSAERRPAP